MRPAQQGYTGDGFFPQSQDASKRDRKRTVVLQGDEALSIYVAEIARNLLRLTREATLLHEQCDIAEKLLREAQ